MERLGRLHSQSQCQGNFASSTLASSGTKCPLFNLAWTALVDKQLIPTPAAFSGTFATEGPFDHHQYDATWIHDTSITTQRDVQLHLRIATANVLTLGTGPKKNQLLGLLDKGRIANLQRQFHDAGCHIIGLQECRTQGQHTRHSSSHYVYQSGCTPEGTHGCELWLDRHASYVANPKGPSTFHQQQVHVASFSHRHIFCIINAPHLHVRVLVVHGPHEQSTDVTQEAWWDSISMLIHRVAPTLPLILLGDTNARLGQISSEAVSQVAPEVGNTAGTFFHSLLLEHNMWIPATFENVHHGTSTTWTAHDGSEHRIDYVAIPNHWQMFDVESYTTFEVDIATAKDDHFVAVIEVRMAVKQSTAKQQTKIRIDVQRCQDKHQQAQFRNALKHAPVLPWSLGIGQHTETLVSWLQTIASDCFASAKRQPRQRYTSSNTWQIIQLRKELLKTSKLSQKHFDLLQKKIVFLRWVELKRKSHSNYGIRDLKHFAFTCKLQGHWNMYQRTQLHAVARRLSRQDRIDSMTTTVQSFYDAARGHDSKALYRALRPLLGQANRKARSPFQPIPAVRLDDGTLAISQEQALERWRSHFAMSEQGIAVSTTQLQQLAQIEHRRYSLDQTPFDVSTVVTPAEIEQCIMQARRGKAPGIDGIPAEVYQVAPQFFANMLWPLFLKCTLRIAEPLRWKGGEVCSLPKSAHANMWADQFRSIMLSDFPAKIRHGILRRKLLPQFCQFKENMQAGGIPRLSPDFMHLFVQAYALWAHTKRYSHSFLFVDIKQAFYKACRPLLVQQHLSEAAIVQLFVANGWSQEMMHSFQETLAAPDALTQASVSPHLRAQFHDILSGTWFQLRGYNQTLSHTRAGTRPGDSVADLLFAFIMTRFLKTLRIKFEAAGLHTDMQLHWIPSRPR